MQTSERAAGVPEQRDAGRDWFYSVGRGIFIFNVVFLVLAWLAFFAVDAGNWFGLRDRLVASPMANPSLWYHLFKWKSFVEILQWVAQAAAGLIAAYAAGLLQAQRLRGPAAFWGLIAGTMILILIEDAGDPRHTLAQYARSVFANVPGLTVNTVFELIFFAALGSLPLIALWRYGRYALMMAGTRGWLVVGFVLYAAVAMMSGTRYINDWFGQTGYRIHHWVTDGRLDLVQPLPWDFYLINFYLMDNLVVESIELIGASAFLLAGLIFVRHLQRADTVERLRALPDGRLLAIGRRQERAETRRG